MRRSASLLVMVLTCCLVPAAGHAYWDPTGNQLSNATGNEDIKAMVPDGTGGAYLAWIDLQDFGPRLARVQRVDRRGDARWAAGGVALAAVETQSVDAAGDGEGGVLVAWAAGSSTNDVYVQRFAADGSALWTAGGVPVAATAFNEYAAVVCPDGLGGAYVVWRDDRTGPADIYFRHFDANGTPTVPGSGLAVSATAAYRFDPMVVPSTTNRTLVVWRDQRNGNTDIYAQLLEPDGDRVWASDTAVCTDPAEQQDVLVIANQSGGAIVAWIDLRNGDYDLYAQSLRVGGGVSWPAGGAEVCVVAASYVGLGALVTDGANGAYVTWTDGRYGVQNVFAQRLDFRGNPRWDEDGIPVCSLTWASYNPVATVDGDGGVIITWHDRRNVTTSDVYAQRFDSDGTPQWTVDGMPILTGGATAPARLNAAPDPGRGMVLAWEDDREDNETDVYALACGVDGRVQSPAPVISAVDDVPADEGGWVRLSVRAAPYDDADAFYDIVTGYNVWRLVAAAPAGAPAAGFLTAATPTASDLVAGFRPTAAQAAALGLPPGTWESLGLHGAMMLASYLFTVPTRTDSTAASAADETYLVTAHTTSPLVVHVSDSADGHSVDNLAPAQPAGLAGAWSPSSAGLQLDWYPVAAVDLDHYAVHRGPDAGFVPDAGTLQAEPVVNAWFDGSFDPGSGSWYKIAALDRHGNVGPYAVLAPGQVSAVAPGMPGPTHLAPCWPNPCNPSATIPFRLAVAEHATLRVFDAAGRLVAVLVDGNRPAGDQQVRWDGRLADGTAAASGVYFYRLDAGSYMRTRKFSLVR